MTPPSRAVISRASPIIKASSDPTWGLRRRLLSGTAALITPDQFFGGRWQGEGHVRGLRARVLRQFKVGLDGTWSEPDRAFHVDETVSYLDGRTLLRHWVVHSDETGALIGSDSTAGRMRVRNRANGFRIRYDRPRGIGHTLGVPSITLDLQESGEGRLTGVGITRLFGFPVARTHLYFEATAA